MDDDALGHGGGQPLGHLVIGHVPHQTELQYLALAGIAHGQGQSDGHKGVGIEALGVLDPDLGPGKGPLEGAHQVQVRDILGPARLGKQQSISHSGHLPSADDWRRSPSTGYGSPAW